MHLGHSFHHAILDNVLKLQNLNLKTKLRNVLFDLSALAS